MIRYPAPRQLRQYVVKYRKQQVGTLILVIVEE